MTRSFLLAISAVVLAVVGIGVALTIGHDRATPETQPTRREDVHSARGAPAVAAERVSQAPAIVGAVELGEESKTSGLEAVVKFPDGSAVPVVLRTVEIQTIPKPQRLAEVYEDLAQRANSGDGVAARTLHTWLQHCRHAFADKASLEKAITRLKTERVVTSADGRPPRRLRPGVSIEQVEEGEFREPFEFCEGVSEAQKQEAETWLELGAKAGDYKAMQTWAAHKRYSQEAVDYLEALWQGGYSAALPGLAIRYGKGVDGGQPDYVRAYALKLINLKLLEAAYEGSGSPTHRMKLGAVEDSLHGTAALLNPQQTQEAVVLATGLLRENANCCLGLWF